ncbi:ABC transporter permease subunit [Actinotalea sp. K2]|uniref:ABC transporter permease n=1 Tax=Actinotalea sp. K2 TaxID=2939438 RepID=UPI002017CA9D|nr:ABC transporter permease subunit [Actinotalea sp. K2]MCL3861330.1 ABC transporter permease subunit [Actinotalea sp. K2]
MTDLRLVTTTGSASSLDADPVGGSSPEGSRTPEPGRPGRAARARRRWARPRGSTLALLPFLAFVGVFLLWPTLTVVVQSVTPDGAVGTQALMRAISGPYRSAFQNSLTLAAATAVLGGVLGLLLALAVRGMSRPAWLRPALDAWCSVASQLGGVPLAFAFVAALGTQGALTKLLAAVGIDLVGSGFSLSTLTGLTVVYLYFQVPLMFLVVMPAVTGLRESWREAATLMGAGPVRYWRTVAAPILLPSTLGGMLLLFINAFSAYATAWVLNSSGQLVPLQIRFVLQGNVITGEQDLGYALVTWTVALLLASLGLMSLLQRRAARWSRG